MKAAERWGGIPLWNRSFRAQDEVQIRASLQRQKASHYSALPSFLAFAVPDEERSDEDHGAQVKPAQKRKGSRVPVGQSLDVPSRI
jgi:hypothetical protein